MWNIFLMKKQFQWEFPTTIFGHRYFAAAAAVMANDTCVKYGNQSVCSNTTWKLRNEENVHQIRTQINGRVRMVHSMVTSHWEDLYFCRFRGFVTIYRPRTLALTSLRLANGCWPLSEITFWIPSKLSFIASEISPSSDILLYTFWAKLIFHQCTPGKWES